MFKNMKPTKLNFDSVSQNRSRACAQAESPDEQQLLARARAGDQGAFAELCKRLRPRLLRTTRKILRNEEDAHDALQAALLSAYLNLCTFDERSSFSTWATRIAINSSLMQLRKRRHVFLQLTDLPMKDPAPNPEALLAEKEERRLLKDAIRSLPQKLRVVVELRQLQERSMQELASELSITCSAAKARFFRAKEMLKTRMLNRRSRQRFLPKSSPFLPLQDCKHGKASTQALRISLAVPRLQ